MRNEFVIQASREGGLQEVRQKGDHSYWANPRRGILEQTQVRRKAVQNSKRPGDYLEETIAGQQSSTTAGQLAR